MPVELNGTRDKGQHDEIRAQQALTAAHDAANAAEWALHNAVIGVRPQVLAQCGDDSNEMQAMSLKKRSDRKRPARTTARTAPAIGE